MATALLTGGLTIVLSGDPRRYWGKDRPPRRIQFPGVNVLAGYDRKGPLSPLAIVCDLRDSDSFVRYPEKM